MGQCGGGSSNSNVDPVLEAQSKNIDKYLREENKRAKVKTKLLVLGAGGGGKSTFLSQIKCIYGGGLKEYSLETVTKTLRQNFVDAVVSLVVSLSLPGSISQLGESSITAESSSSSSGSSSSSSSRVFRPATGLPFEMSESLKGHFTALLNEFTLIPKSGEGATVKDVDRMYSLFANAFTDPCFTEHLLPRLEGCGVPDSARYLFEHASRILAADFEPTTEDLFRMRIRTSGIVEYTFNYEKSVITLIDVGGQRSERSKWIHCFQEISCLLFFVSLAEYDQRLEEDVTANRMIESLTLFEELVNSRWFSNLPVALFLNKRDIFEKKISYSPLQKTFPDFPPGGDTQRAMEFVLSKFQSRMGNPGNLSSHFTCATDTDNIRNVFNTVATAVLSSTLSTLLL